MSSCFLVCLVLTLSKTVFVIGGSAGLGKDMSKVLAGQGKRKVLCYGSEYVTNVGRRCTRDNLRAQTETTR